MNNDRKLAQTLPMFILAATGLLCSCGTQDKAASTPTPAKATAKAPSTPTIVPPTMVDDKPRDYAGLHNVVAYHDGY